MKVEIDGDKCVVTREQGDPKFRDGMWGDGESWLLYRVKQVLKAQGHDLVKKRMSKDGHMVDDRQQYLRTRSPKSPEPHIYVLNGSWAIEGADKEFNRDGRVELMVVRDVFEEVS